MRDEQLTDASIFAAQYRCSECGKDAPVCGCGGSWEEISTSYLLAKAVRGQVADIECERDADGRARVSIPQRWIVHSPTGFEWGYGGSGPADLALNVLGLFVPPREAWLHHQQFKADVIAKLPREGGVISADQVTEWLLRRWHRGAS